LVHAHQFLVHTDGRAASGQAEHDLLTVLLFLPYGQSDALRDVP
jgi:hypothetical protein